VSFFDYPNEQPAAPDQVEQLLPDATEAEWATLLRHTSHRRFGPGETVIAAGERERSLYLVLDGRLEVLAEHGRRRLRRIATIEAGSVLGELSFFDGAPRSALVRTLTPAVLAELSPAEFDTLAAANPVLARRLLFDLGRILAQRLRAAHRNASVAGVN